MEEGEYVLEFESEHDEDFNMAALKMPGGHAHHHHDDDHDDQDNHDDEEDDHDDHDDEEDDHDDHDDEMCHNAETHENYESTEEECEAAGHAWMGDHEHDLPEIHADYVAHTLSFPEEMVCYDISTHTVNMTYTNEDDCVADGLMWVESNSGPDGDDDHSDEEEHHEIGYVIIHIEEE